MGRRGGPRRPSGGGGIERPPASVPGRAQVGSCADRHGRTRARAPATLVIFLSVRSLLPPPRLFGLAAPQGAETLFHCGSPFAGKGEEGRASRFWGEGSRPQAPRFLLTARPRPAEARAPGAAPLPLAEPTPALGSTPGSAEN